MALFEHVIAFRMFMFQLNLKKQCEFPNASTLFHTHKSTSPGDAAQHSRAAALQVSGVAAVSVGVDEPADGILVVIMSSIHLRHMI